MLANSSISNNYNIYQNKLIRIISPFSGEQFKIELGGKEEEFRDLLATLLNIDSSYIKGLKDSYGNYYTLSSALNDLFILSNENNLFSLVLNISNKNSTNKFKQYHLPYDRNMLYNVNNNYHNRTEYNEIYIGHSNKTLLKSKSNYRYTTLIKELIPAINRNFKNEDNFGNKSFYDEKLSLNKHPKYEKILENNKKKFPKEQYNILKELLKMENITIINCFKTYEKTKDKKDLIKNLNSLYKKYQKKLQNSSSSSEDESSSPEKTSKQTKKSKYNKKNSEKSESPSDSDTSSKQSKKNRHHHRHKKKESSSSSESESEESNSKKKLTESNTENNSSEEAEEQEETSEDYKNNFPIKCSSLEEVIDNIKELLSNKLIRSCLFTNDIDFLKKLESQKTQFLKDTFDINNFIIQESNYEAIKNYYDNIMKKVIEKDMTEDEKNILHKLIKNKNKSVNLRFRALLRHNNYDCLSSDLKECIKDYLKRKHGSEKKVKIKGDESISINSSSNTSNENDNNEIGENIIGMDDSSKSIRKNERMAKKNNNNRKRKSTLNNKETKKEEESVSQFKLLEMNDASKADSNSKKGEHFTKSRKSSSKVANEKNDDMIENNFIPIIKKFKEDGDLDITDDEINILINEYHAKTKILLSIIEEYQQINEKEEFIDGIKTFLKSLYEKKIYTKGEPVTLIEYNDNKEEKKDNTENKNIKQEELPYEKEIINELKGSKFNKKGNKKIINILLKNNAFTEEQIRIIEEDLEQNNSFISGAFELFYITNNVRDLVENLNIKLQLSQSEKENQIKTNLEIIMKSFNEEEQNKVRELYEAKDSNLMDILESEMNDIKKVKSSILNFLEKKEE